MPEEEPQPRIQPEQAEDEGTEKIIPMPSAEVKIPGNSVLIRGSVFSQETLELKRGEAVIWKNLNRPKRSFLLVSEEELFGDSTLGYGKSFAYTFEKAGTYTFRLDNVPTRNLA